MKKKSVCLLLIKFCILIKNFDFELKVGEMDKMTFWTIFFAVEKKPDNPTRLPIWRFFV